MSDRRRAGWWVPPALLALAVIPVAGGNGRLVELLMAAAWAINLAIAEWVIRRPAVRRAKRARTALVGVA